MKTELFNKTVSRLENGILEVDGLQSGVYDAQAASYDKIISNRLYNKIMWGNCPRNYTDFCLKGLNNHQYGTLADIGCGTLSFTSKAYAEHCSKDILLCDLSMEMLSIGKVRLESVCDDSSGINFLRADALDLPMKAGSIQTLFSFGLFHIFTNPSRLIQETARVLKPDGTVYLTSLCTDRKWSAKYLSFLHKKEHVAKPLHAAEIKSIIEENGIEIVEDEIIGGMLYVTGKRKDKSA